jgi:hypothetical protein
MSPMQHATVVWQHATVEEVREFVTSGCRRVAILAPRVANRC